mmetsp:Transcript_91025/g.254294  ORF Transcript_91025/g.254294 Transcript_91025/m.254294 type:complete len:233 (+) Transcript_91025:1667-2365(+)
MTKRSVHLWESLIFSVLSVLQSTRSSSFASTLQTRLCSNNSTCLFSSWNKRNTKRRKLNGLSFHFPITRTVLTQSSRRKPVFSPCLMMNAVYPREVTRTMPSACTSSGFLRRTRLCQRIRDLARQKCSRPRQFSASGILLVLLSIVQKLISWRKTRTRFLSLHKICWRQLLRRSCRMSTRSRKRRLRIEAAASRGKASEVLQSKKPSVSNSKNSSALLSAVLKRLIPITFGV